jgi:uncharacterized protein (TIGR00661 family)
MNILYGIQATGNGHITRSRLLVKQLRYSGHNVQVILSGRNTDELWDIDDLKPYDVFTGLTYTQYNGKVHYWQTLKQLRLIKFFYDVINYQTPEIDLVITDFDPISAYIAKINKIPSMGIGHQYAFNYDIPLDGDNPISKLIMKIFAPADVKIGLHWSDFGQPILPPIIPDFGAMTETDKKKILVYLPYEDHGNLIDIFNKILEYNFFIYTDKIAPGEYGNIIGKAFSKINFKEDLKTCGGVICNAGFELPSEALSLGKKILVRPIEKQMEQISNAKAMKMLSLGSVMYKVEFDVISDWLKSENSISKTEFNNVTKTLSEWISNKDWSSESVKELSSTLWNKNHIINGYQQNSKALAI